MKTKKAQLWRALDPAASQEQEKYGEQTIPSRELILHTLEQEAQPRTVEQLCAMWKLHAAWEVEALRRRLRAMKRAGQVRYLRQQGYALPQPAALIVGRVIGHAEGHGFLIPDDGRERLFLSARQMQRLLHGDRAAVQVVGYDERGYLEARVAEVLERNTQTVVGRFHEQRQVCIVIPDNRRIQHDIIIPPEQRGAAQEGQIVIAELLAQPTKNSPPLGRIKEVLGEHMAAGMEVRIAIANHSIPLQWPDAALQEAHSYGDTVSAAHSAGRWDMRELPLVTIDGITARDFDDAVYAEQRGNNWRLLVAIADVASYVPPGSALDAEAHNRGNSVYFPDRAIPMLPEALANGLCSLNPNVERLALVCDMTINAEGRIIRSRFAEALMRSHARLTYDTVAALLEDDAQLAAEYVQLLPQLQALRGVYAVLRRNREQRGALDFDTQETVIEYGADGKIAQIVPSTRNDAHRLIEECMIAANVAAARFLQRHKMPTLYRIHQGPSVQRLQKLRPFLQRLGLTLGGGDQPTPQHYCQLLAQIETRADAHLVQTMLLRSLAQAVYNPDNFGHFGLALPSYVHFTSPIRRYPDLQVHRAIRHVLHGGNAATFSHDHAAMQALGEHCSMTERRADDAVREAVEWLKCEYMLDKVGQTFTGLISGVTGFGLFVELRDIFVEGLIHVTALRNDYYRFDAIGQCLEGEGCGRIYRLGDTVRVRVLRVDLDQRRIDFEPVGGTSASRRKSKARRTAEQ